MEENPASSPMVKALATKMDIVIKEMGLNARITIAMNETHSKKPNRQVKKNPGFSKAKRNVSTWKKPLSPPLVGRKSHQTKPPNPSGEDAS